MGGPIERPSWDEYFLNIADVVKTRAVCTRRQVGALIVRDNRIISTGYNGAPAGMPHCDEAPCPRGILSYKDLPAGSSYSEGVGRCIAVHAEANAILYAGREACRYATLYCTHEPCAECRKLIKAAGVARVVTPADLRVVAWAQSELNGPT